MNRIGLVGKLDNGSGTTVQFQPNQTIPVGSLLIVAGTLNINNTVSVSDGFNSYTTFFTGSSGTPVVRSYVSFCIVTHQLTTTNTITITGLGVATKQAHLAVAYSGISAVDKSSVGSASSGINVSTPASGVLSQPDELLISVIGTNQLAADTITMSGWTQVGRAETTSGTNDRRVTMWEKVVSATTSVTPSATLSASTTWAATLTTFKIAAAPSSPYEWYVIGSDGVTMTLVDFLGVWDGSTIQPADVDSFL